MLREEALALLRRRTGRDDLIDLLERRHPDVESAEELLRLAVGLLAEADDAAARVADRIPELSQPCRDVLRLRLMEKPFDEISAELDLDAEAIYRRCRRRLFPSSKPLTDEPPAPGRALEDQATFNSVRDDLMLDELLRNSGYRGRLLEATESVRFTFSGSLREWFERPKSKVLAALALLAVLSILVKQCGLQIPR